MNATTAIILVNWNGWRNTIECMQSLQSLDHPAFAVVLVDNASTDESMAKIQKWLASQAAAPKSFCTHSFIHQKAISAFAAPLRHRSVSLVQSASNNGFAAGNNLGLRIALQARCDYMWLLNNDTVVDPHALTALENCMQRDRTIGMVGSVLRYYDQPDIIQAVGGVQFNFWRSRGTQIGQGLNVNNADIPALAKQPLSYVAGASMLVSMSFLNDVGLMYEGYFLYFEEIEWASRACPKWTMAIASTSVVFHKEGGAIGTSSRASRSLMAQYYLTRNSLAFFRQHKPALLPIALVNSVYEGIKQALTGEWELASCTFSAIRRGLAGEMGAMSVR